MEENVSEYAGKAERQWKQRPMEDKKTEVFGVRCGVTARVRVRVRVSVGA